MLMVNEIFESVFGEGINIGKPCTFIRCTGCNLFKYGGCDFCDTGYAQDPKGGIEMSEEEIVEKVEGFGHRWITITGGEPLIQNLKPLLLKLRYNKDGSLNDCRIQLETNCSLNPMQYSLVSRVALSPKLSSSGMTEHMYYEYMSWLNPGDEVKFVIASEEDFNEAVKLLQQYKNIKAQVVMQPEGGVNGKWIVEKILKEKVKGVRVLPQLHKAFGLR